MAGVSQPAVRLRKLLLGNQGWAQIVLKNTFWLFLSEGVVRVLKFAVVLLIVRHFGPTEYGKFAFAFSFVTLCGIVFEAGLVTTSTREFSRSRENEQFLPDIILMRLAFGILGMAIIVIGSLLVTDDPAIKVMILALGIYMFMMELIGLAAAIFRARQKMEYETLLSAVQAVVLLAGVWLVIWRFPSIVNVSYAHLGAVLATLLILAVAARTRLRDLQFQLRPDVWKRLLQIALPLALVGGVSTIYHVTDSTMLGLFGRFTETGWYNAATRISGVIVLPMSILSLSLFPAFAATSNDADASFKTRWNTWFLVSAVLGAFFLFLVLAASGQIVRLAFGDAYAPTGTVLNILVLSAFLLYVYMPWYQALVLFDRQKLLLVLLCGAALANVILNLALIPPYGLFGAAWATVVTHMGIFGSLFYVTRKYTPIKTSAATIAGAAFSAGIPGVVAFSVTSITGGSLWFSVPLGGLIFWVSFVGIRKSVNIIFPRERFL